MHIFRKISVLILLLIALVSVTKNSLVLTYYYINTEGFVATFCENKLRPELKCNGKCKVAKMAKETTDKETANALSLLLQETFVFFQNYTVQLPETNIVAIQESTEYALFVDNYNHQHRSFKDKPPQPIVL